MRRPRRLPAASFAGRLAACLVCLSASTGMGFRASAAASELPVTQGTNFAIRLSPNAEFIAMDLQGALFVLPTGGGEARRLTDGSGDDRLPAWHPGGERLAFQSFRDGSWQIWTIDANGRNLRQLTRGRADAREPVWKSDGQRIVYASDRAGNFDLWELDVETGSERALTNDPADDYLPSAGHGNELLFVSDRGKRAGIWRLSPDGAESLVWEPPTGVVSGAGMGANGSQLAVVVPIESIGFPSAARHALVVVDATSGDQRVLSAAAEDVFPFTPQWRDESTLLYTADGVPRMRPLAADSAQDIPFEAMLEYKRASYARRSALRANDTPQSALGIQTPVEISGDRILFTALGDLWQRDGAGKLQRLTDDVFVERDLSVSADGQQLAFISDRDGSMRVWSRDLSTGAEAPLGEDSGVRFPALSPDGQWLAYLKVGPRGTQDFTLRVLALASGEARRLKSAPGLWPETLAWSADGSALIVTALISGSERIRDGRNRLLRIDVGADTAEPLTLPEDFVPDSGAVISPNGEQLAVVRDGRLWMVDVTPDGRANGRPRRLVNKLVDSPAWSADAASLIYLDENGLSRTPVRGPLLGRGRNLSVDLEWRERTNGEPRLIHAGRLFDGRGEGYRADVDILVRDGRIESVRPHRKHDPAVELIDASNQVVLPGLIDHHVHHEGHQGEWTGRAWLAWGVTSVVEPGGLPYASRAMMEAWDSGRRPGPRLFFAGPQLDGERKYFPFATHIRDAQRLDWELERAGRLGYAMIKTYTRMPIDRQQRVIRAAHRRGLPVSSHELYPALALGADRVEHLRGTSRLGYSSKQTALLRTYGDAIRITGATGAAITPTLVVSGGFFDYYRRHPKINELPQYTTFYDAGYRRGLQGLQKMLARREDLLRTAAGNARRAVRDYHRAGARIVAGTDSPIFPYGLALVVELANYVEAGLRPAQALRAATSVAAAELGAAGQLGEITAGARADLVIIDGDPLTEISDLTRVRGTLRSGRYFPLEELLRAPATAH
jgi:Tol biopolymer transport system component/imidazolonepropionase-like amidohydrolase